MVSSCLLVEFPSWLLMPGLDLVGHPEAGVSIPVVVAFLLPMVVDLGAIW